MSTFELKFSGGVLRYRLVEHPIVHVWSRMAEWYYNNIDEYRREEWCQQFDELSYKDETDKLRDLAHRLATEYPDHFDKRFQEIYSRKVYTRADLNYLHGEGGYERIRIENVISPALPEAFNDQIHMCERFHSAVGSMETNPKHIYSTLPIRPRIRVRFIHKGWEASAPWKLKYRNEDEELFEQVISGKLYLAYAEVGKPPYSVYRDQDTTTHPVFWTNFGPAFYVTFQNWKPNAEHEKAVKWLDKTFGGGPYWMGEPCMGVLDNMGIEDAFAMIYDDPVIRGMKWTYGN